jgi:hypothetical protein
MAATTAAAFAKLFYLSPQAWQKLKQRREKEKTRQLRELMDT